MCSRDVARRNVHQSQQHWSRRRGLHAPGRLPEHSPRCSIEPTVALRIRASGLAWYLGEILVLANELPVAFVNESEMLDVFLANALQDGIDTESDPLSKFGLAQNIKLTARNNSIGTSSRCEPSLVELVSRAAPLRVPRLQHRWPHPAGHVHFHSSVIALRTILGSSAFLHASSGEVFLVPAPPRADLLRVTIWRLLWALYDSCRARFL